MVNHNTDLTKVDFGAVKGFGLLTFTGRYNRPFNGVDFKNVRFLNFIYGPFNQSLVGVDFKQIERVILLGDYNQSLVGVDLGNIKTLELGPGFVDPSHVGVDFKNVRKLVLGNFYNRPLDGVDFGNVHELELGHNFNQSLDGVDFRNIRVLHLGVDFVQSLAGVDFKNVTKLTLRFNFPVRGLEDVNLGRIRTVEWERWASDAAPSAPRGFVVDPERRTGSSSCRETHIWSLHRVDAPTTEKSDLTQSELAIVRARLHEAVQKADVAAIQSIFLPLTGEALTKASNIALSKTNLWQIGETGSLDVLKCLLSAFSLSADSFTQIARGAIYSGQLELFKYLIDECDFERVTNQARRQKQELFELAVESGNVECAAYLAEVYNIKPEQVARFTESLFVVPAADGHLDMLDWVVNVFRLKIDTHPNNPRKYHDQALCKAAEYGHVEVIEWIIENFCVHASRLPVPKNIQKGMAPSFLRHVCPTSAFAARTIAFEGAAARGHLEVLKCLVTRFRMPTGADRDEENRVHIYIAYEAAVEAGHAETAAWIAETFAFSDKDRAQCAKIPPPSDDPEFNRLLRTLTLLGAEFGGVKQKCGNCWATIADGEQHRC